MLRVVLDTTVFCRDFLLKGADALRLRDAAIAGHCTIHISPVVKNETLRRQKEDGKKVYQELEKAFAKLADGPFKLGPIGSDSLEAVDKHGDDYPVLLEEILQQSGFTVDAWPNVTAAELCRRDLDRRKPFRESGQGSIGMRDTLVWLGVLDIAERFPHDFVALVSNNRNDFGDIGGDKECLHSDLICDIESRGCSVEQIVWVKHLGELFERFGSVLLPESQVELRATLSAALHAFDDELMQLSWLEYDDWDGFSAAQIDADIPPMEGGYLDVLYIEGPYDIHFTQLNSSRGQRYRCQYRIDVGFEGFINKADIIEIEIDDVEILDGDWNNHVMLVGFERSIELTVDVSIVGNDSSVEFVRSRRLRASAQASRVSGTAQVVNRLSGTVKINRQS